MSSNEEPFHTPIMVVVSRWARSGQACLRTVPEGKCRHCAPVMTSLSLLLMPPEIPGYNYQWLRSGQEAFPAMLAAIDSAQQSVCLETYIFAGGGVGDQFRDALVRARQRGTQVRVLVDGLGSH